MCAGTTLFNARQIGKLCLILTTCTACQISQVGWAQNDEPPVAINQLGSVQPAAPSDRNAPAQNWAAAGPFSGLPVQTASLPGLFANAAEAVSPTGRSWLDSDDESDISYSFGPDPGESRGTLFQWSYGTSFSGGPDLNEPIVTDRPDFTEASVTVGRGVLQVESGYTYSYNNDGFGAIRTHSYPETLFRYGILADWLELRVAQNFFVMGDSEEGLSGADDLYLGLKIALTPQEGVLPEMALLPQMTVPTGAVGITANRTQPGVNWIYSWELGERLSTAGSTQFNCAIDGGSGDAYTEWAQSWTFGISLTERWGGYTEWFGLFPHGADTVSAQHYFNGGFTYLISDNMQWDLRGGTGLSDAADDYFIGSGISIRFARQAR